MHWLLKGAAALAPVLVGALTTIAWQNSHGITVLTRDYQDLHADLERAKTSLEPVKLILLRLDVNDRELAHLRELVENRMGCPAPAARP